MVAAVSAPATHDLKRLGFVSSYAATASHMASSAYAQARAFTPGLVEPFVQQAEETALTLGAPYLALAQDKAEKVLTTVDSTVDASVQRLSGVLSYAGDVHSKNLATFDSAKQTCYGLVEGTVATAKLVMDPAAFAAWASETVRTYVDPDKILDTSFEVAGKVATFGPVPKVLETADPLIKTSKTAYEGLHDTLVSLPVYKQLWELLTSTGVSLQDSWAVKKLVEVGYPLLKPVADPVVANISNSKYLKQLQSHLAPAKKA